MRIAKLILTRPVRRLGALSLFTASAALLATGCDMGNGMDVPKTVQVRFGTFDVGTDDCEDIFSFGDFSVEMTVTIQPRNEEVFTTSRSAELGSAALQATVQSIDLNEVANFELQSGESFDIDIRVTEDDPVNSSEPQPWEDSESFDFLTVTSRSLSFTNGPGCFRDDRIDIVVTVTE